MQSAADPPKKLALGERAVHGRRQRIHHAPDQGEAASRSRSSTPTEGTPLIIGPNGIFKARAAIPTRRGCSSATASRPECQQLDRRCRRAALGPSAGQGEAGPQAAHEIKTMKEDAAAVEKKAEEIKARYVKLFRCEPMQPRATS